MVHRHIVAWLVLSMSAELLGTVLISVYPPVTLQAVAKGIGYWGANPDFPCSGEAPYAGAVCRARILGHWLDISTISLYVKSAGTFIQLVLIPTFAPFADDHRFRLPLLAVTTLIASSAGLLYFLLPARPTHATVLIISFIACLINAASGIASVCTNAFLRTVAREQTIRANVALLQSPPAVSQPTTDEQLIQVLHARGLRADDSALERMPLLNQDQTRGTYEEKDERVLSPEEKLVARMSGVGLGGGFLSAIAVLLIGALALQRSPPGLPPLFRLQATISLGVTCVNGVALCFLPRATDIFQDNASADPAVQHGDGHAHMGDGWRRILSVLRWREIRALPSLFVFLVAFGLLADVMHTSPATTLAYMQSRLNITPAQISQIAIFPLGFGGLASLIVPLIQPFLRVSSKSLVILGGVLLGLPLVYGSTPLWAPAGWGGYTSLRVVGFVLLVMGISYGMILSYGRALYSQMIPIGHESTFFSLFSLADRTCSFTGPLLVGLIANWTGGFDWVWLSLALLAFASTAVIAVFTNPDTANQEGKQWHKEERIRDEP